MKSKKVGRPRKKYKDGRCVYCLCDLPKGQYGSCDECGYKEDKALGKVD